MNKKPQKHSSPLIKKLMAERDPVQAAKVKNRMMLAVRIEDAMKAKGIKKKELAEILGKKPSVITKWLSGTHNFTSDILTEIGLKLGVELLNTEEKPSEIVERFVPIFVSAPKTKPGSEEFLMDMDSSLMEVTGSIMFKSKAVQYLTTSNQPS